MYNSYIKSRHTEGREMKAELVFPKAAKKLNEKYLGMKRDGAYLFGYFENADGNIVKCFYFPAIKTVVKSVQESINEGRYQDSGDYIRKYFSA